MNEKKIDPWNEQRLLAIRHAGTVYAAALALVVTCLKPDTAGTGFNTTMLKWGEWALILGVFGAVVFQFVFIGTEGKSVPWWSYPMLIMVGFGAGGIITIGLAAII